MSEENKGFTVRDRRKVKLDGTPAETKEEAPEETAKERPESVESRGAAPDERSGSSDDWEQGAAKEKGKPRALPPVDFTGFVFGFGQMALVHLGEIPEPDTGQASQNLEQARHVIDILDMLEEKTRGNLAQEEADLLRTLKSELKLKFVKVSNLGPAQK
jgi:hypothetical protein